MSFVAVIKVSAEQRRQLERIVARPSESAGLVRRARVILLSAAAYMRSWNKDPTPFAWTKPANAILKSHRRMLERISMAVHCAASC